MDLIPSKEFLTIVGSLFAALFFAYKLWTGWLIIDLKLKLTTVRQPLDDKHDHLVVTVGIEKGTKDSMCILDLQMRLTELVDGKGVQPEKTVPIHGYDPIAETEDSAINWKGDATRSPIYFSPGDSIEFACYEQVKAGGVFLVEVVLLGDNRIFKRLNGRSLQWRSSTVSLPVPPGSKGGTKARVIRTRRHLP